MRSVFVVINQPLVSDGLNLFKIGKKIRIKHLSAVSPIKALDKGILVWLAWLDILDGDTFGRCPFGEHLRDQFRPIVQPYGIGWAVAVNQAVQRADQPRRWDRCANFDDQALSICLIYHIQLVIPRGLSTGI